MCMDTAFGIIVEAVGAASKNLSIFVVLIASIKCLDSLMPGKRVGSVKEIAGGATVAGGACQCRARVRC